MTAIGSIQVSIQTREMGQKTAVLTPATIEDIPNNWSFAWQRLWQVTDLDCQNIIKLLYDQQVWGFVRYGLYPYPGQPKFIEIEHLEANPISRGIDDNRLIVPIGQWLIWYATQVGLKYCSVDFDDPLVVLVSLEEALCYYRDTIGMEFLGATTIAPGEDGYAFRFNKREAISFCSRIERQWGKPSLLDS
jgi:hypothetical protein